ncbi:MAG: class F sortase [Patescibacteria group bacterium]|jgi:LPXTG-site transpeptidase (sortase) family protein
MHSKMYVKLLLVVSILAIISSSVMMFLGLSIKNSYAEFTPSATGIKLNSQMGQNIMDDRFSDLNKLIESMAPRLPTALLADSTGIGVPVRLKIPKIKVDTVIERVGLTPQGAVDVPKGPSNAAWFEFSPRPGDSGNAIITGHYGIWKNGKPTVFNGLSKLVAGDRLYIEDEKGRITVFIVRQSRSYDPKADVPEVFISSDGKAHLNLITCEGAWNKSVKSYPKRLVIFADKE